MSSAYSAYFLTQANSYLIHMLQERCFLCAKATAPPGQSASLIMGARGVHRVISRNIQGHIGHTSASRPSDPNVTTHTHLDSKHTSRSATPRTTAQGRQLARAVLSCHKVKLVMSTHLGLCQRAISQHTRTAQVRTEHTSRAYPHPCAHVPLLRVSNQLRQDQLRHCQSSQLLVCQGLLLVAAQSFFLAGGLNTPTTIA